MEIGKKTSNSIFYKTICHKDMNKPWITMLHGFSMDHRYFSEQVKFFQDNYNLLLTDLRGHGKSSGAKGPYGIEEYADDVIQVFDDAGIEKTHYWGTHTGAAVGLVVSLRQPERFLSLILEGTTLPGFSMPKTNELLARGKSIAMNQGLGKALEDWFENADWFAYIRNNPLKNRSKELIDIINGFKGASWLSDLSSREPKSIVNNVDGIKQPVLLYNGEFDLPDFKNVAEMVKSKPINVQSVEIPKTGGFPAWEKPDSVNILVSDFLSNNIFPI